MRNRMIGASFLLALFAVSVFGQGRPYPASTIFTDQSPTALVGCKGMSEDSFERRGYDPSREIILADQWQVIKMRICLNGKPTWMETARGQRPLILPAGAKVWPHSKEADKYVVVAIPDGNGGYYKGCGNETVGVDIPVLTIAVREEPVPEPEIPPEEPKPHVHERTIIERVPPPCAQPPCAQRCAQKGSFEIRPKRWKSFTKGALVGLAAGGGTGLLNYLLTDNGWQAAAVFGGNVVGNALLGIFRPTVYEVEFVVGGKSFLVTDTLQHVSVGGEAYDLVLYPDDDFVEAVPISNPTCYMAASIPKNANFFLGYYQNDDHSKKKFDKKVVGNRRGDPKSKHSHKPPVKMLPPKPRK